MMQDRTTTHTGHQRIVTDGGDVDQTDLDERLQAVERALTGADRSVADLHDEATATAARESLADRVDELERRIAELEAATQAVRGYVGSIRAVNREVERRADLALARASDGQPSDGRTANDPAADGRDPSGTETEDATAETQSSTADPALTDQQPTASTAADEHCAADTTESVEARYAAIAAPDTTTTGLGSAGSDAERDARAPDDKISRDVIDRIRGVL